MRYFFATILFFFSTCAVAQIRTDFDSVNVQGVKQDSRFRSVRFIPGKYRSMSVDMLDNIFVLDRAYRLKKYNANGDSSGVFNDVKQYGDPSLIDVANPFKILVYYKNFSTAVILDRFLAFRNSINFRNSNIFSVRALTVSYDNNIWLYDEQDMRLKKIDDDGKVLTQTSDFRQIFDEAPRPSLIMDRDKSVYLYDESKGFYVFDYYGSLKNNLPFTGWKFPSAAGGKLMGFVKDSLQIYELNSLDLRSYSLPAVFGKFRSIIALNGKVYLLKEDGVEVFDIF